VFAWDINSLDGILSHIPPFVMANLFFHGTRILVADVLEQVAAGMAWEAIS